MNWLRKLFHRHEWDWMQDFFELTNRLYHVQCKTCGKVEVREVR